MGRRIPLALIAVSLARAQTAAPTLDVCVSTETVPADSMAQIKVYLGTPQPISSGSIALKFTGLPAEAPQIQGATVFSAAGDVAATGFIDDQSGMFNLIFVSPSAGVGRLPGVPILEFSIPVANSFAVDASSSSFAGPSGNYAMTAQPGGATTGGSLSIQGVTPTGSTGILPAGSTLTITGAGFQNATVVEIAGVSLASIDIASPNIINATLAGATEITGKQIVLRNPDGSQIAYWGGLGTSLYSFPLPPTSSAIWGRMGPPFEDPISLVVQNPNPVAAQVTISNTAQGSQTVSVPSGGTYRTPMNDPPYSTVQSGTSTPIRILGFVSYSYDEDPLTILPVASQSNPPSIGTMVSAASGEQSAVSPGEIVTIYGTNIGPSTPAGVMVDGSGNVARILSGVQVLFDGIPAPLLYASASQVSAVVPYEIFADQTASVQVVYNGAASATWGVPVAAAAPAIFTLGASGVGPAAVLNQDNSVNSPANPAAAGSILQVFATGEGLTAPAATTGVVVNGSNTAKPILPVNVTIGGETAAVLYAGSAPGSVAGLLQVNAQLPNDLPSGSTIPIVLMVGSQASQASVTVAVK